MKKYLTIMVLILSTSAFGSFDSFIKKQAKDTLGDGKITGCEIEDSHKKCLPIK